MTDTVIQRISSIFKQWRYFADSFTAQPYIAHCHRVTYSDYVETINFGRYGNVQVSGIRVLPCRQIANPSFYTLLLTPTKTWYWSSTMQDQKFIVWIKSRGDYQCLMAYRRIYLFSTVSGFIYLSSYYYEGESAGGWGIHVNLFRRGGWRKLEREQSCRFVNRPLKAGACSWDWLLPLPILGMCLDAKIKIPNFFSGTCMET